MSLTRANRRAWTIVAIAATLLVGAAAVGYAVADRGDPPIQAAPPSGDISEWAERTSALVGVPERALLAYGTADLVMREISPTCGLSWSTLAAIGRVESNHGRYGKSRLRADGSVSPTLLGLPLDGRPGIARILDTDDGALDGDAELDRAVGPMQFIPSTWRRWRSDGDGDGNRSPHDLDDAALAAGRYLCAGGRDVSTGEGWWKALYSYNRSVAYGQRVHDLSATYTKALQTPP